MLFIFIWKKILGQNYVKTRYQVITIGIVGFVEVKKQGIMEIINSYKLHTCTLDVHHCFAECTMVDTSDAAWQQAQLSLSRGGLGLHHLSLHSPAAYIASAIASDSPQSKHLLHAIDMFNASVSTIDDLTITSITTSKLTQKLLSAKLEDQQFTKLFVNASLLDKAHLLSIFLPHSSA